MKNNTTPTQHMLFKLWLKLNGKGLSRPQYHTEIEGNKVKSESTGFNTYNIYSPISILDHGIIGNNYTTMEKGILAEIAYELKNNNCLWICPLEWKNNGMRKRAIKKFIEGNILMKTETVNIYVVNPEYIRRGNPFTILASTIKLLDNVTRVEAKHVVNKNPISQMTIELIDNNDEPIGYGYTEDTPT